MKTKKPWYSKKRFFAFVGVIILWVVLISVDSSKDQTASLIPPTAIQLATPSPTPTHPIFIPTQATPEATTTPLLDPLKITASAEEQAPVSDSPEATSAPRQTPVVTTAVQRPAPTQAVQKRIEQPTPMQASIETLSNDNSYINSQGNTVHSPAYANTVPAGVSARCRDGTYSFSQSRRGTCSGHGGVGEWL